MNRYTRNRQAPRGITVDDVRKLVRQRDQLVEALQNERAARERAEEAARRPVSDRSRPVESKRIAELEARVAELEAANEELVATREAMEDELERHNEAESRLKRMVDELTAELESGGDETSAEDADRLRRELAGLATDLDRVRRNADVAASEARISERRRLLSRLGDVFDSVDRALEATPEDSPWFAGIHGIRTQLVHFMESEGAALTGQVGEMMNPHRHEALNVVEADDFARGEIVRVHRPGIELDDGSVIRSAQVSVAA